MAANENNTPIVEDSGSLDQRRASIDKKLQRRPTQDELKERHILLDTKAAP